MTDKGKREHATEPSDGPSPLGLAGNGDHRSSPFPSIVAPLIAIAATTIARKALDGAYRGVTGHQPPDARDPNTRLRSALMWAAMTAATAALVEVAVYRITGDS